MEEGSNSEQTAKYNEGYFQTQRMHEIWLKCNRNQVNGEIKNLKWELFNAWMELSTAAQKLDEQGKIYDKDKKISWCKKFEELKDGLTEIKSREEIFNKLFELQLFLRLLQDKSGKGTKWVDADEDDIE